MLRIFQIYFPVRTLLLLLGEALVVTASFLAAVLIQFGPDSYIVLNYESGLYKILLVTMGALLCAYYFDLYLPQQLVFNGETYFRLLLVLGLLSFVLAAIGFMAPQFMLGKNVFITGLFILTIALLLWRSLYLWLIHLPYLCQRVYVLGSGEQAAKVVTAIRERRGRAGRERPVDRRAVGVFRRDRYRSVRIHELEVLPDRPGEELRILGNESDLLAHCPHLVDVGGQSTRPGSARRRSTRCR